MHLGSAGAVWELEQNRRPKILVLVTHSWKTGLVGVFPGAGARGTWPSGRVPALLLERHTPSLTSASHGGPPWSSRWSSVTLTRAGSARPPQGLPHAHRGWPTPVHLSKPPLLPSVPHTLSTTGLEGPHPPQTGFPSFPVRRCWARCPSALPAPPSCSLSDLCLDFLCVPLRVSRSLLCYAHGYCPLALSPHTAASLCWADWHVLAAPGHVPHLHPPATRGGGRGGGGRRPLQGVYSWFGRAPHSQNTHGPPSGSSSAGAGFVQSPSFCPLQPEALSLAGGRRQPAQHRL